LRKTNKIINKTNNLYFKFYPKRIYSFFSKQQICLLTVARDSSITQITTISTSFSCDSISPIDKDTFLVGTVDHSPPVRTVTVQGQEGYVQHGSLPNKTYKFNKSSCTFVQHEKTVVLVDRFAHSVHFYNLDNGTNATVQNSDIRAPVGVCGRGDRGSVFLCSTGTGSVVQLSARGELVKVHSVDMFNPYALSVSMDGRTLVVANSPKGEVKTIKLFRVEY